MGLWLVIAFLFCAVMGCTAKDHDTQVFYWILAGINVVGMIAYIIRPPDHPY